MFAVVILFAACSKESSEGSDFEDKTPVTEVEKKIIGGWPELGDDGLTFMKNGIVLYIANEQYGSQQSLKVGHWVYDEETKVLTTDIKDRYGNVLMWQISLLQDGSMAGIQLWDSKTFSASRDIKQAIKNILDRSRYWTRDKNGKFLTIYFNYSSENSISYYYVDHNADFWIGYYDFSYSQPDLNTIVINSEENGCYKIHNPYNNDVVYFEFPDGRKYYPVKDGMEDITSVKMSKEESKLVGKWICKQQVWEGKTPGSIYLEDDYGMEFTDMYWGEIWSGEDELMNTGREKFSWFIKDKVLYIDDDHYYILQLTDQEMTLEWRDGENVITCNFYKLNENGDNILANSLEYVDLGLSVKWATYNLGATQDNIVGDFYAWGETCTKDDFLMSNYKYFMKRNNWSDWPGLTKYCSDPHLAAAEEYVDNKMYLDDVDDAVIANKGKDWRMPTNDEFKELIENCTLAKTWSKGKYGLKITGKTGYYIFMPFNGYMSEKGLSNDGVYGCYLTNSCGIDYGAENVPPVKYVKLSGWTDDFSNCFDKGWRSNGYNIRPVHK